MCFMLLVRIFVQINTRRTIFTANSILLDTNDLFCVSKNLLCAWYCILSLWSFGAYDCGHSMVGQCQYIYFLQTFMLTMRYFYMEKYNKASVDTPRLVQALAACEQVIMKDAQPGGAPWVTHAPMWNVCGSKWVWVQAAFEYVYIGCGYVDEHCVGFM